MVTQHINDRYDRIAIEVDGNVSFKNAERMKAAEGNNYQREGGTTCHT